MRPFAIIEGKILFYASHNCCYCLIIIKVYIFILDAAPQSLHENIIESTASAVHADPNIGVCQATCELVAGKLSSMIRVENFRFGNF